MKIYGLLGNPLSHSFSKKYFSDKFRNENIKDCDYLNFETTDLREKVSSLKNTPSVSGLNVTIPYKSQIISYLDITSPECQEIGACNCIKVYKKKWIGFNTDIIGFEKTFFQKLTSHHSKALILGTGGSSKAVAYVLKKLAIKYLFVSRKKDAVKGIINYNEITPTVISDFTVIINTTPIGMFPNVDTSPDLPYEFVSKKHYFFDLIYNPQKTLFLSKAEEKGAVIENGKRMLSIQAEESWNIWNQRL